MGLVGIHLVEATHPQGWWAQAWRLAVQIAIQMHSSNRIQMVRRQAQMFAPSHQSLFQAEMSIPAAPSDWGQKQAVSCANESSQLAFSVVVVRRLGQWMSLQHQ